MGREAVHTAFLRLIPLPMHKRPVLHPTWVACFRRRCVRDYLGVAWRQDAGAGGQRCLCHLPRRWLCVRGLT